MTTATLTLPTDAQLKAVLALNSAFNEMEIQLPSSINGDRAMDIVSDAIHDLHLPEDEDDLDAPSALELFWELCEERGLI